MSHLGLSMDLPHFEFLREVFLLALSLFLLISLSIWGKSKGESEPKEPKFPWLRLAE